MSVENETDDIRLRRYLWLSHGHYGLYGDDGEMQCSQCSRFGIWDYKRAPVSSILDTLEKMGQARIVDALTRKTDPGWDAQRDDPA